MAEAAAPAPAASRAGRALLLIAALAACLVVALFAGGRYGLMLLIGLGLGAALEANGFGFAGPWRAMILRRAPGGLLAQLLAIALTALVALPLLAAYPGELSGAHGPVGYAMIGGAFVFGAAMQVVLGCGSGTLVNAGSGNPVGLLALPFFAIGSFFGAQHLGWWTALGAAPVIAVTGWSGLALTLAGLGATAALIWALADPAERRIPRRFMIAALLIAALAAAHLAVAGQPWGVVYGLGLWVAKAASAAGAEVAVSGFWAAPVNAARLRESLLTDITSLTNLGLIGGAMLVALWRGGLAQRLPALPLRAWIATVLAGLALGYSSRLAFGCNVGAFFSGVSTGSLHGWVWFVSAFAGSALGVRLRAPLGLEAR